MAFPSAQVRFPDESGYLPCHQYLRVHGQWSAGRLCRSKAAKETRLIDFHSII
jgi:hypothetical protein